MSVKVSIQAPLAHYQWGDGCDGWNFVEESALSVKQERMPAGIWMPSISFTMMRSSSISNMATGSTYKL